MCGRFGLFTDYQRLVELFSVDAVDVEAPGARYNIAPTEPILGVVRREDGRHLGSFRWGMETESGPRVVINARAEGLERRPLFRTALSSGRLVVPADGFYEWKATGEGKRPFFIRRVDGSPMAFAGLTRRMLLRSGSWADCAVIVTTAANATVAAIHDRMPVVLEQDGVEAWLGEEAPSSTLQRLLKPAGDEVVEAYPVGTKVNKAGTEGRELIERVKASGARALDEFS